jgi:peptide methionine sulfoxide reductase MsrA
MLVAIDESERWPNPTVTVVRPAEKFWRAEEYHQQYYKKQPSQ